MPVHSICKCGEEYITTNAGPKFNCSNCGNRIFFGKKITKEQERQLYREWIRGEKSVS